MYQYQQKHLKEIKGRQEKNIGHSTMKYFILFQTFLPQYNHFNDLTLSAKSVVFLSLSGQVVLFLFIHIITFVLSRSACLSTHRTDIIIRHALLLLVVFVWSLTLIFFNTQYFSCHSQHSSSIRSTLLATRSICLVTRSTFLFIDLFTLSKHLTTHSQNLWAHSQYSSVHSSVHLQHQWYYLLIAVKLIIILCDN